MHAEIVSIGTELLLGTITDTNASFLAQRLAAIGIDCYYVSQVGDNLGRLVDTLDRACKRSDLVIATHGRTGMRRWLLGSVADKLSRETPCPDLIIGPNVEVELDNYSVKRIVVALDGSELSEEALPVAAWIAACARSSEIGGP